MYILILNQNLQKIISIVLVFWSVLLFYSFEIEWYTPDHFILMANESLFSIFLPLLKQTFKCYNLCLCPAFNVSSEPVPVFIIYLKIYKPQHMFISSMTRCRSKSMITHEWYLMTVYEVNNVDREGGFYNTMGYF